MALHDTTVHAGAVIPHASSGKKDLLEQGMVMLQKLVDNGGSEFIFKCTPATKSTTAANITDGRKVKIQLVDSLGNVHTWFNGTITTAITKSSTGGTVTNVTSLKLVNGEGVINVACAGTWVENDTNTVTASAQTKLGVSLSAQTSVETATA